MVFFLRKKVFSNAIFNGKKVGRAKKDFIKLPALINGSDQPR